MIELTNTCKNGCYHVEKSTVESSRTKYNLEGVSFQFDTPQCCKPIVAYTRETWSSQCLIINPLDMKSIVVVRKDFGQWELSLTFPKQEKKAICSVNHISHLIFLNFLYQFIMEIDFNQNKISEKTM